MHGHSHGILYATVTAIFPEYGKFIAFDSMIYYISSSLFFFHFFIFSRMCVCRTVENIACHRACINCTTYDDIFTLRVAAAATSCTVYTCIEERGINETQLEQTKSRMSERADASMCFGSNYMWHSQASQDYDYDYEMDYEFMIATWRLADVAFHSHGQMFLCLHLRVAKFSISAFWPIHAIQQRTVATDDDDLCLRLTTLAKSRRTHHFI